MGAYTKPLDNPPRFVADRLRGKPIIAVDTETTLIAPDVISINGKSRIAAPRTPDLILGSIAVGGDTVVQPWVCVHMREEFLTALNNLLLNETEAQFIFHNLAFDFFVIDKASPAVGRALARAVESGRVYDTMNREILIQIAQGRQTFANVQLRIPRLADLAARRCGMKLTKDTEIRCGFEAYAGKQLEDIPDPFLDYAAQDAVATLKVFAAQEPIMAALADDARNCPYPIAPDAVQRWGLLGEHIQARGCVALRWLESFPLRVDRDAVRARRKEIWNEFLTIQALLISWGWGRRAPRTEKFHLSQKAVREALATYARDHGIVAPLTDSGLLTLEYDFWADVLPRRDPAELNEGKTLEDRVHFWLRYNKLQKLISTYIDCYESADTHFTHYWNLVTRTTRTSSVRPNVQNIPKHHDSIRAFFVPSPGYHFYEFDFKAAELAALAQIHVTMFGQSILADVINAGGDPHIETAKKMVGTDTWKRLTDEQKKKYRQMAKAFNFGLPGGLGAAKLQKYAAKSYKVKMTIEETKAARNAFLDANPQLREYLKDHLDPGSVVALAAQNLGFTVEKLAEHFDAIREDGDIHYGILMVRLRNWTRGDRTYNIPTPDGFRPIYDLFRSTSACLTGIVRGRSSYTEGHNFPFQSLVACALKLGLWNLYLHYSDHSDSWRPVVEVHDSVLIEVRDGDEAAVPRLADAFRTGLQILLPNVLASVDVDGPKDRWGEKK